MIKKHKHILYGLVIGICLLLIVYGLSKIFIREPFQNESRLIPKVIYQTWKTKDIPEGIQKKQQEMMQINPGYSLEIFDDADIDAFIKDNFDEETYSAYTELNVGAGKADFWRYCILYKRGGIYLDMDSTIIKPLDDIIGANDSCVITRENNKGYFNQWILIFQQGHPVLKEAIRECVENIKNKSSTDLISLTGPGVFSRAINTSLLPYYNKGVENLYYESDEDLNGVLNDPTKEYSSRFFGIDMNGHAVFKTDVADELYNNTTRWRYETKVFK